MAKAAKIALKVWDDINGDKEAWKAWVQELTLATMEDFYSSNKLHSVSSHCKQPPSRGTWAQVLLLVKAYHVTPSPY